MTDEELIALGIKIKPLEWGEPAPPGDGCHYDHCRAETPFGRLHIDWKSWKDYPSYGLDCLGNHIGSFAMLDHAKEAAAAWYMSRIEQSIIRTEPTVDVAALIKQAEIEEALAEILDFEWGGSPGTAAICRVRAENLRELAAGWQNPNKKPPG